MGHDDDSVDPDEINRKYAFNDKYKYREGYKEYFARSLEKLLKPRSEEEQQKQQRLLDEAWEEYEEGIANDPDYLKKSLAEERAFTRKDKKAIPDPSTPGLRFLVTKAHGIEFIIDVSKIPNLTSDTDEEERQLDKMFSEAEKRAVDNPEYFHKIYDDHKKEQERIRAEWENYKAPWSNKTRKEEREEKARFFKEYQQLLYEIRDVERRLRIRERKKKQGLDDHSNFEKIKIGRCCFTCMHRKAKESSNYIICKYNNAGHKLWEKAHCAKWELTTAPDRLSQYEAYSDTKNLMEYYLRDTMYGQISRYDYYYRKNNNIDVDDDVDITLGQCCFICQHRTTTHRKMVHCSTFDKQVWGMAKCRYFLQTKDFKKIDRFKKYMKKSNVDVSGTAWCKNFSTLPPDELELLKAKRVKKRG